jgi:hypothetical protein
MGVKRHLAGVAARNCEVVVGFLRERLGVGNGPEGGLFRDGDRHLADEVRRDEIGGHPNGVEDRPRRGASVADDADAIDPEQ